MKRKRKKGVVYILKAISNEGLHVYKYGASTISGKSRIPFANTRTKLKFNVLFEMKSKDIFYDENTFRWDLYKFNTWMKEIIWDYTYFCSEVFSFDCCMDEEMIQMLNEGFKHG